METGDKRVRKRSGIVQLCKVLCNCARYCAIVQGIVQLCKVLCNCRVLLPLITLGPIRLAAADEMGPIGRLSASSSSFDLGGFFSANISELQKGHFCPFSLCNYGWMTPAGEAEKSWWNFTPKCNALSLLLNYPLIMTIVVFFHPLSTTDRVFLWRAKTQS